MEEFFQLYQAFQSIRNRSNNYPNNNYLNNYPNPNNYPNYDEYGNMHRLPSFSQSNVSFYEEQPILQQPRLQPSRLQPIQPSRLQPSVLQPSRLQPSILQPPRLQPIPNPIQQPRLNRLNSNNDAASASVSANYSSTANIIGRFVLQTLSNVVQNAVHNISQQIQEELQQEDVMSNVVRSEVRPNVVRSDVRPRVERPSTHYQFVIMPYKNMVNKKDNTSFPICFDDYEDNSMVLATECIHYFHEDCLKKWVENDVHHSCPICRTSL